MISETPIVSHPDTLRIVRLLGRLALVDRPSGERRRALMEGLADLVDADAWLWVIPAHTEAGERPADTIFLKGGFTDEQFARFNVAEEHPDMIELTAPFFEELARTDGELTRLRQEIDPENRFVNLDVYQLWREADIAPLILSARSDSNGLARMIGLYRNFDRPLFEAREANIAHLVFSAIPRLEAHSSQERINAGVAKLSPRLRQVLNCLLQGQSRKEVASGLGISIHTVGDYISEIYRRFDAHSQSDLIRQFLSGQETPPSQKRTERKPA